MDESRRDEKLVKVAANDDIRVTFVHDSCIVPPGILNSRSAGTPFGMKVVSFPLIS